MTELDILLACQYPLSVIDLEPDSDPPKVLIIGSNTFGNLIEIIMIILENDEQIIIHAMRLWPTFFYLLPDATEG